MKQDDDILQMALKGYESQLTTINTRIADIRRQLGGSATKKAAKPARKKHHISPEGLARIRAAQKKRWAAAKK